MFTPSSRHRYATNKPDGGCGDANLRRLATSNAAGCATASASDAFCGTVSPAGLTTSPWPFLDKSGNANFQNGEFYEGGVNLSLLGLAGECFASVGSETRSSTSTTATLKDFILGGFAACTSGLTTTPKTGAGGDIPAAGLSIGSGSVSVADSAQLTISGVQNWTGTLSFHLCGPNDLLSQSTCVTGGTAIGSALTITNSSTQPILSTAASVTSVGKYCWRGDFVHTTNGVPDATDSSAGECFTVIPANPGINTIATAGPLALGQPISDLANLSLTANQPGNPIINPASQSPAGGSITFTLYGPGDNTCASAPVFTSLAILVSGNGSYGSGNYTPVTAGTYRWIATYTGNSPNTTGPVATACNDTNEVSVISPNTPTIVTNATAGPITLGGVISDTATIASTANRSNGTPAGGTVTFTAYGPSDTTCSSTPVFTSGAIAVSGNGNYGSGNFTPTLTGTYRWIATYTGDLPNTSGPVHTSCNDPNEASVINQIQPTISTGQTFTIKDSATITAASGGNNLAGSVRFRLFNNASCDTTAPNNQLLYDSNTLHPTGIAVGGALSVIVNSDVTEITISKPVLSWLVEYTSTNVGHKNVTSACNTENANLTISNGS